MDSTITIHNSPLELQFSSIQQYPSTAAGLQEGEEVFPGPPSRSSQWKTCLIPMIDVCLSDSA